jgi:hypothetical protein
MEMLGHIEGGSGQAEAGQQLPVVQHLTGPVGPHSATERHDWLGWDAVVFLQARITPAPSGEASRLANLTSAAGASIIGASGARASRPVAPLLPELPAPIPPVPPAPVPAAPPTPPASIPPVPIPPVPAPPAAWPPAPPVATPPEPAAPPLGAAAPEPAAPAAVAPPSLPVLPQAAAIRTRTTKAYREQVILLKTAKTGPALRSTKTGIYEHLGVPLCQLV